MALKDSYANDPGLQRKERSEKILNKHNIRINTELPVIEDKDAIKSPEEILKRAVTALFAAQIAMDCLNSETEVEESADFFGGMLENFGLENETTPDEKKFFALTDTNAPKPNVNEANRMARRIEMVIPLLWACGIVTDDLPYPDKPSDFIEQARMIASCDNFGELMQNVRMRKTSEILDKADLIYRMDWACADARVKGETPSGNLNSDVVCEQHKGLNWIICANDAENWDKVKSHT